MERPMSRTLILLGFAKWVNSSIEIPSMARKIRRNLKLRLSIQVSVFSGKTVVDVAACELL